MTSSAFSLPTHAHLIGIGGAGMSALARLYLASGVKVSGSDVSETLQIDTLRELGADITIGHHAETVANFHQIATLLVVISSAIPSQNPELLCAMHSGMRVEKHASALATFLNARRGIAIAGTHGKTTTTAMTSVVLRSCGYDPSFQVGGELIDLETSAMIGAGDWMVVEADEYDRRFLAYNPEIAVLTNCEPEHFEFYESVADMEGAYATFAMQTRPNGAIIALRDAHQHDTARLDRILSHVRGPKIIRYGHWDFATAPRLDGTWWVTDFLPTKSGVTFVLHEPHVDETGAFSLQAEPVSLGLQGLHNCLNAVAAIIVATLVGASVAHAAEAIATFRGVRRRFQLMHDQRGIRIFSDYAHHPTEVRATLRGARDQLQASGSPGRVWAVFQPHLMVRTDRLFDDFVASFEDADRVVLTDVYSPAGREPAGAYRTSADLTHAIASARGELTVQHVRTPTAIAPCIAPHISAGDVVVVMGAGPIDQAIPEIIAMLP